MHRLHGHLIRPSIFAIYLMTSVELQIDVGCWIFDGYSKRKLHLELNITMQVYIVNKSQNLCSIDVT